MKTIDIDLKIKDIEPINFFEAHLSNLFEKLLNDKGISMDQKIFDHTYRRLAYFLKKNHKNLIWGEVCKVFEDISSGYYQVKFVSTSDILACFVQFQKVKVEQNRIEYEKKEQQIQKNAADLHKTPYGKAILFRTKMREKGINKWDNIPLKEIAEKIANNEINI